MRQRIFLLHSLGILLVGASLCAANSRWGILKSINNSAQNICYRSRSVRPGDRRIVLVAIDDESISRIGSWPWRRDVHARLIDRLTKLGARTIAFDVMFMDASPYPDADRALAEATRRSGRVVLASLIEHGLAPAGGSAAQVRKPLPEIAAGAIGFGAVSVQDVLEADGTIRLLPSRFDRIQGCYSLEIVAVAHYLGLTPERLAAGLPRLVPLNYGGPWAGNIFQTIPASHVLDDQLTIEQAGSLQGALVFVGSVSFNAFDHFPSPFGGQMPGILARMTAADNILRNRPLRSIGFPWGFLLLAVPMTLLFVWLTPRLLQTYLAGAAGIALAALLLTWLAFQFGLWLRPDSTLLSFLTALAWTAAARQCGAKQR